VLIPVALAQYLFQIVVTAPGSSTEWVYPYVKLNLESHLVLVKVFKNLQLTKQKMQGSVSNHSEGRISWSHLCQVTNLESATSVFTPITVRGGALPSPPKESSLPLIREYLSQLCRHCLLRAGSSRAEPGRAGARTGPGDGNSSPVQQMAVSAAHCWRGAKGKRAEKRLCFVALECIQCARPSSFSF